MAITINGSGSITGLTAGGLPNGSIVADDLASSLDLTGKTVTLPSGTGGKILQVDVAPRTATYTTNSTSWTTVPNFDNSITTIGANSQILIVISMGKVTGQGNSHIFRVRRGSTDILLGDTDGSRERVSFAQVGTSGSVNANHAFGLCFAGLDSPSVAAGTTISYSLQCRSEGGPMYINRSYNDYNDSLTYNARSYSSYALIEVAV